MSKAEYWPSIKSHSHYPAFLIRIAELVPAGQSKKVFENWDKYVKSCAQLRRSVSITDFKKRYFYDVLESVS